MAWGVSEGTAVSLEIELPWKVSASVVSTVDSEISAFGVVWVGRTGFEEVSIVFDVALDLGVLWLGVDPSSGSVLWKFPVVSGVGVELVFPSSVVVPFPRTVV